MCDLHYNPASARIWIFGDESRGTRIAAAALVSGMMYMKEDQVYMVEVRET